MSPFISSLQAYSLQKFKSLGSCLFSRERTPSKIGKPSVNRVYFCIEEESNLAGDRISDLVSTKFVIKHSAANYIGKMVNRGKEEDKHSISGPNSLTSPVIIQLVLESVLESLFHSRLQIHFLCFLFSSSY